MRLPKRARGFGAAFAAMCLPMAANAATIVSTFDAGSTYNCCIGWTVSGPSSAVAFVLGGSANVANAFAASRRYTVERIDLAHAVEAR